MVPRDTEAGHRGSTSLELLFDLTFVVAVAQAAHSLAEHLTEGHIASGIEGYASVFFAIWWAWVNFTWFASAFDNDDVPYRLLTLLQMSGVLVLAAGVPRAFDGGFTTVTVGYVIMRVALLIQWLRAGLSDRCQPGDVLPLRRRGRGGPAGVGAATGPAPFTGLGGLRRPGHC